MKSSKKKIEQVETHIKELSSWSQKGTRAVYKTRRCERILSCKSEANGCTSEVKTKTTRKRAGENESRTCERRIFS